MAENFFENFKERNRAAAIINQQVKKQANSGGFIPMFKGRPIRPEGYAKNINADDILNLMIALNTSKNFKQFLAKV